MIDRRRKQKTVLPIQSFIVPGVAPRFDVTRAQVFQFVDVRDPALALNQPYVFLELSLAPSRHDQLFPLGFGNIRVLPQDVLQSFLPGERVRTVARHLLTLPGDGHQVAHLRTDQAGKCRH
jgi:hypothetical protein